MRIKAFLAVVGTALVASPAHALMVAGWDMSQWAGDGTLISNGTTFAFENTLSANYSDLDAVGLAGLGPDSAAYGTLYFDGSNGSDTQDPFASDFLPTQFAPAGSSLSSNPAPGIASFNQLLTLLSEGQDFATDLSMVANGALSVVFQASVLGGTDWALALATQGSAATTLDVEVSDDGSSYGLVTSLAITPNDDLQMVDLSGIGATDDVFVRLTFSGVPTYIDNVSLSANIAVPEPSTLAMAFSGLVGLGLIGRRRR
jgi:hypothetical protein